MRRWALGVALVLAAAFAAGPAAAEMYRYTDSEGQLHFVDDPGSVPKKYRAKLQKLEDLPPDNVIESPPAAPQRKGITPRETVPAARSEKFSGTVEVYLTDWCPYCTKTINYLKAKGVSYTAYNIDTDAQAKRRHRELGGRGVPLVVIGPNKISGFSPDAMDRYLGL